MKSGASSELHRTSNGDGQEAEKAQSEGFHVEYAKESGVMEHHEKSTSLMLLLAFWLSFAAWIANFDSGYQGTVLIMPTFNKAFGHCQQVPDKVTGALTEICKLSTLQQSLVGVNVLFIALGGGFAALTGSYLGRRGTIQFACGMSIIGAAGMLGSKGNFLNYMVCKCIGAFGIGHLMSAAMIYGSECVASNKRGLFLGLYNVGLGMGNVAASAVCAGTSKLATNNDWQWRAPIICQIPLGIILGIGLMMFPESPRWLMVKGREADARKSFARYQQLDPNSAEIDFMLDNVRQHIELDKTLLAGTSWGAIYRGVNLRRTLVSAFILVSLAITGIQFVAPYAALFLSGVGIANPYLINVIIGLCIFGGTLLGPASLEYGGRRFCLLVGYTSMSVCMLIFSAVSTALGPQNPVAKNLVIVFLCLWAFIFGGLIGSSAWLASAEMHSVRLRTFGQANTVVIYNIFAFGATFWTPYMLSVDYGDMGANVGYFYFGITAVVIVLVYFFVPETARLSLEQIDDHFLSGRKAWKTSLGRNKAIASGVEEN
jgi:SP family sugar:H+ symporter-like MFS transporter